jgi:transcriptional regulator with XRE-family HTH domain
VVTFGDHVQPRRFAAEEAKGEMIAKCSVSSAISIGVVELLLKRSMTLTSIAEAIGVTKSFLSRVKARTRSLTIDHLVTIESVVGEPLPLLLLHATPIASVPKHLRPLYRSTEAAVAGKRRRSRDVSTLSEVSSEPRTK